MSNGYIHCIYCSLDDSNQRIYEAILDCNSLPSEAAELDTTPTNLTPTRPVMQHSFAVMSRTTTAAFIPLILLTLSFS